MHAQHTAGWSRREFFAGLTLAGTAGVIGGYPGRMAAEVPPERSRIRLAQIIGICVAPSTWPKNCCAARDSRRCSTSRSR